MTSSCGYVASAAAPSPWDDGCYFSVMGSPEFLLTPYLGITEDKMRTSAQLWAKGRPVGLLCVVGLGLEHC